MLFRYFVCTCILISLPIIWPFSSAYTYCFGFIIETGASLDIKCLMIVNKISLRDNIDFHFPYTSQRFSEILALSFVSFSLCSFYISYKLNLNICLTLILCCCLCRLKNIFEYFHCWLFWNGTTLRKTFFSLFTSLFSFQFHFSDFFPKINFLYALHWVE